MATVRSIAAAALRRIGVLSEGETPSASQAADALESLNALLDQWAAERLQVPVVLRTRVPLVSGVGAYRLAPVTADAETLDGFDGAWDDVNAQHNFPDGWTLSTVGGTQTSKNTLRFQSTPRSLQILATAAGDDATLYRDIVCGAGTKCTVSLWMTSDTAGTPGPPLGKFRVQNVDTGLHLGPDGTWGTAAVDIFESEDNGGTSFLKSEQTFYLDPGAILGDTLRFTMLFEGEDGNQLCLFDTFDFINYADIRERPVFVDRVNIIDGDSNSGLEIPLREATDQGWASLRIKGQTSALPGGYYYNPTFPYGSLHFWPVPDRDSLTAIIYAGYPITKFGSTTNTFYLPPGYERMIVTNLALELAPEYNAKPSELLIRQAIDSMQSVKRANFRMVDLGFEGAALIGGRSGPWDIRSGP